jgi:hypothetical protein
MELFSLVKIKKRCLCRQNGVLMGFLKRSGFRNEKGTSIYETVMTMPTTWKQRGLDPSETLAESLTAAWSKS